MRFSPCSVTCSAFVSLCHRKKNPRLLASGIKQQFTIWALGLALISPVATLQVTAQESFVEGGEAGFVVAHITYAVGDDASETGTCPMGMTAGYESYVAAYRPKPDIPRMEGEKDNDFRRRVSSEIRGNPDYKNLCINPELGEPDPKFKTVVGSTAPVDGIDMDGQDSQGSGQCPHFDFAGRNGETGIDNQFWRAVGCSEAFQAVGQGGGFETEMHTGAWGILITLSGIDDIRNDDDITVGIYANADPIQLSPSREPLPYATYAIEQDPRFRTTTKGRITDGVLTMDPADVRIHSVTNSIRLERYLKDAVVQMTLSEDGTLEGILAGYSDVDILYDQEYGFRSGTDGTGNPANMRLRAGSALGQARVQNHTCEGAYYALFENADGHPDPETGKCTSISTQYKIQAIPAYVVDMETESVNEELIDSSSPGY